ncbi:MAG: cytochrome P450 [Alcaligenaceae bacterium]|nr:cytochrome P450 [Alcaligenaceae bacterium]
MSKDEVSADDVYQASIAAEPIRAYDKLRQVCPIMHDRQLHWSLFRHGDVLSVIEDHDTFSSQVSKHVSVPNGMDPPEHTVYRKLIDPYFNQQRMANFESVCRRIADNLVQISPKNTDFDFIENFARIYAVQVQCAFLGWPVSLQEPLTQWVRKNHQATLAQDRPAMAAIALEFDGFIRSLLDSRRAAGDNAPDDLTNALMRETVDGQVLADDVIVSILRNWTVGELGTIAACVGILVHYLAEHEELQQQLREKPVLLPAAIDEILRIHPPLISNRRITTKEVTVGGHSLDAGERLTLLWASANRDEDVFGDPDNFCPERNAEHNLLYGAGIHVCPGAPLARLVLRLVMESLLSATQNFLLNPNQPPVHAKYPAGGFDSLELKLVVGSCCGGCGG